MAGRAPILRPTLAAAVLAIGGWASPSQVSAVEIRYQVLDLEDAVPGMDLWQYAYLVSESTFAEGFGFTIYFDHALIESLEDSPLAPNSDWDTISVQPEPQLRDDGFYDALALRDNPSLSDLFFVSFVWLGAGTPRAQEFEIYDPDFVVIESGITVPEPSSRLLQAAAGIALVFVRCCSARLALPIRLDPSLERRT